MKRSYIAAGFVLAAAIYEALAVWTNQFRTITELVEDAPSVVELVVVGGLLVWILDHFGWLDWLPWRHEPESQLTLVDTTPATLPCECSHERRFHSSGPPPATFRGPLWDLGCNWPDCPCTRFIPAHSDAR